MINKLSIKYNASNDIIQTKRGIYIIRCISNNKVYIGQCRRVFISRWLEHQWMLENKHKRCNIHLLNAFSKYGNESFVFDVLEIMPDEFDVLCRNRKNNTKNDNSKWINWLNDREMYWIAYYKNLFGERMLFNKNDGGTGMNPCLETRKSISNKHKVIQNLPNVKYKNSYRNKKRYESLYEHIKTSNALKRYFSNKENYDKYILSRRKINYKQVGEKVSKKLKEYYSDDINRKRHSSKQKEIHNTEKVKHNHLLGAIKRYSNESERKKLSKIQSIAQNKQGVSERKSKSMKEHFDKIRNELDEQLKDIYIEHPEYKKLTIPKKKKLLEELHINETQKIH